MKTKKMFFSLFVTLFIFTGVTSVTAQKTTGYLSCNFQEVVNNPNPYLMTVPELLTLRKQGIVPAGITVFHTGITREMVDRPAVQDAVASNLNKEFKRQLVAINTKTEIFAPVGKLDADAFKKHSTNIEASIKIGTFDFHGQPGKMTSNQWQGNNLAAGSVMVEHDAIRILECAYYDFGQFGIFPFQVLNCGNMLEDKLMFAVMNNTAHLVSNASANNNPGPSNPGPGNTPNTPNASNTGGGGNTGLTFEQMLALAEKLKPTAIFSNIGSNNGNNNGVTGAGGGGSYYTQPEVKWTKTQSVDPAEFRQQSTTKSSSTVDNPNLWVKTASNVPVNGSTMSTSTSTTNGLACGTCGESAWNRKDVAFVESELVRGNKYAKRTADATTATAVGVWVMPVAQPFINWGVEKLRAAVGDPVGGGTYNNNNYFASNSTSTYTAPLGNAADWINSGGTQCPVGWHHDGTQCVQ